VQYESPGFAASSVFQQQMMLDAAQRRQAMLDDITKRKADSDIELGHAALEEKRAEAAERVREKERAKRNGMWLGWRRAIFRTPI
jgi:hypothetical protein